MIDTLRQNLKQAVPAGETLRRHGVPAERLGEGYAALTLHRPSNVDDAATLRSLLGAIREVGRRIPVVFPVHPRTRAKIEQHGLAQDLRDDSLIVLPPAGYLEMLGLMQAARLVLTDSGGIQEETTALGVPCVTLRENTERPITVNEGTNTIVGQDPARVIATVDDILRTGGKAGRIPELWDGQASQRIAAVLREWLDRGGARRAA
jgi:UDP-N-acetylglucosamine 2-epimerase (non-hydrolysing)